MSAFNLVLGLVVVLFGALGIHHSIKVRRAMRTDVIEGLILGFGGKHYSAQDNPVAFWVNVVAGFAAVSISAIIVLLGGFILMISILVAFGVEVLSS